jgi:hypothetical protein
LRRSELISVQVNLLLFILAGFAAVTGCLGFGSVITSPPIRSGLAFRLVKTTDAPGRIRTRDPLLRRHLRCMPAGGLT